LAAKITEKKIKKNLYVEPHWSDKLVKSLLEPEAEAEPEED
jgi:hypothetical protein